MQAMKKTSVLKMIVQDMKQGALDFDGRPFNGKTVGICFGHHGAAIAILADILRSILENGGDNEDYKAE